MTYHIPLERKFYADHIFQKDIYLKIIASSIKSSRSSPHFRDGDCQSCRTKGAIRHNCDARLALTLFYIRSFFVLFAHTYIAH